ncbi:L-type lectin-domain containing receptor kinase VIII.2 [Hibiscus syriacus]|uniref:non-specific serine/threonine protein kinase n=1 Tax=Hibiscus syriacus TaxID=106335 RepID=A0A6A2XLN1_HIBSY|nr:L-type lectin-domain containing receptor kinase VIII.2 [Hibiscus syriacus]
MLPFSYKIKSIVSLSFFCYVGTIFGTTEFDFGTLTLSSLKLLGDAHLNNGSVSLTRELEVPYSGSGRVLYSKPVRFRQSETNTPCSFSTFFSFSVTNLNPSSIGGGLAFVISPNAEFVGAAGGSLGLLDEKGQGLGFVAVEFDTLMDVELKDINGNHAGLDLNSVVSSQVGDLGAVDIDLKSGDLVNSWIDYDALSNAFNVSISQHRASQHIEWWSFSSSFESNSGSASSQPPSPTTTLMNPTANTPPPSLAPSGSDSSSTAQGKTSKSSSCHNQLCKQGPGAVAGVVTAGAFFLALFAAALIWVYSKKFKKERRSESFTSEIIKSPKEFTYKELKEATRCFNSNRIIGHGAFGIVYKGEILLVYDLMPNGSLDKALYDARTPLPWVHRQKIVLGVASALAYLHQECDHQVIHRDVKTSNIMLDEGFNAKLGDFGLARQVEHDKSPDATVAAGTMGYLAPEYLLTGRATEKTDIFSYGAVVLEVASGRRPIERDSIGNSLKCNTNLVEWVWGLHQEGRLLSAADPRLEGEFEEGSMRRVLMVGLACSHPDPMSRPTMRGVVQMLVGEAEVPVVPRTKPSMSFTTSHLLLSLQDSVSDCNGVVTVSSSSSENSYIGPELV